MANAEILAVPVAETISKECGSSNENVSYIILSMALGTLSKRFRKGNEKEKRRKR